MADNLFEPFGPGFGVEWLEGTFIPQTLVFYAQLLPVVYRCGLSLAKTPLTVCDIGAATAAGTTLLHDVLNNLMGLKVKLTAVDMEGRFLPYAQAKFEKIEYVVGDFLSLGRRFDIVVLSHTLEHIERHGSFVQNVLLNVDGFCIVFVPFEEEHLIPGHVRSFSEADIAQLPGFVWGKVFRSVGWRTEENARVALFVLASEAMSTNVDLLRGLVEALDSEFLLQPLEVTSFRGRLKTWFSGRK